VLARSPAQRILDPRFIGYIKDELLIVLGTSSSETVLPHMMQKMERLGASKSVVGLVIPTGYSFNLDGTNIYMTLATLFLAQATNTPDDRPGTCILVIAMITSKRLGVTGAGFVTLAATLAIVPTFDPVAGDPARHRQVHERMPRADHLVGNGVATVVISRWEASLTPTSCTPPCAPITVGEEMERTGVRCVLISWRSQAGWAKRSVPPLGRGGSFLCPPYRRGVVSPAV